MGSKSRPQCPTWMKFGATANGPWPPNPHPPSFFSERFLKISNKMLNFATFFSFQISFFPFWPSSSFAVKLNIDAFPYRPHYMLCAMKRYRSHDSESLTGQIEPTLLMWPWWVKVPTEDFTYVTLAIDDTYGENIEVARKLISCIFTRHINSIFCTYRLLKRADMPFWAPESFFR